MSLATPDYRARKPELNVRRGLEVDLLGVHPRVVRIRVAFQTAHEKLIPERPRQAREQRDVQRLGPVDLERVDVLSVVAVEEAAALCRSEPVVALAEGYLVIQDAIREICLHDTKDVRVRNRAFRNRCLDRIAGHGYLVNIREGVEQGRRISRSRWRMLVLATNE